MSMKTNKLISIGMLSLLCFSCSSNKTYTLEDYIKTIEFGSKSSLNVLQLADIHFSFASDLELQKKYLQTLISKSEADIVIMTGDQVLSGNANSYTSLLDIIEESSCSYFAFVYGNHDEQGLYDKLFPIREGLKRNKCLNTYLDDDLFGDTNFVINIKDGSSLPWQIYGLDSGSLKQGSFATPYDVIHDEQIDWYENEVKLAKSIDPSSKSLTFFHIPLWESEYAYRHALGKNSETDPGHVGRYSGTMKEKDYYVEGLGETRVYAGYKRTSMFAKMEELGSTKAVFNGHDHKNDFCAEYYLDESKSDDPIALCYGLKSGNGLSYLDEMQGGDLAKIGKDGSLELYRARLDYSFNYSLEAMF